MLDYPNFVDDPTLRPEPVSIPDRYFGHDIAGKVWDWLCENIPAMWRSGALEKQPIQVTVYLPGSDEMWFQYTQTPRRLCGISSVRNSVEHTASYPRVRVTVSGATKRQNDALGKRLVSMVANFMQMAAREWWKTHPGQQLPDEHLTRGELSPICILGLVNQLRGLPPGNIKLNCSSGLGSLRHHHLVAGANTSEPPSLRGA